MARNLKGDRATIGCYYVIVVYWTGDAANVALLEGTVLKVRDDCDGFCLVEMSHCVRGVSISN